MSNSENVFRITFVHFIVKSTCISTCYDRIDTMKGINLITFAGLTLAAGLITAETIHLKNGNKLEGILLNPKPYEVVGNDLYRCLTPHSIMSIPANSVERIQSTPEKDTFIQQSLFGFIEVYEYQKALQLIASLEKHKQIKTSTSRKLKQELQYKKEIQHFERRIHNMFREKQYKELTKDARVFFGTHPKYEVPGEIQEKLIDSYTRLSLYALDHVNYYDSMKYIEQALLISKGSPKVHQLLITYAEATGNEIILKNEKKHLRDNQTEKKMIASRSARSILDGLDAKPKKKKIGEDYQLKLLLQAYNAGPGALIAYQGEVSYPETKTYIKRAQRYLSQEKPITTPYDTIIEKYAAAYALPKKFVQTIVLIESSGNKGARSRCGARGLMQIMKPTWKDVTRYQLKVKWDFNDAYNPERNIEVGCAYLKWLNTHYVTKYFGKTEEQGTI